MTTNTHALRRQVAPTEALLWALWSAARITGVGALLGAIRDSRPADWSRRFSRAVSASAARTTIRAQLAAAEFLTGPAADAIGAATARVQRQAPFILAAVFVFASLIPSAIR